MHPLLAIMQCFARCVTSCMWSNNKTELILLCKYDVVHKQTVHSFRQFLLWQPTKSEREVLAQILETSKKFVTVKGHYFDDK